MNLPGYDAWKLSGPPESDGPTCEFCGNGGEIRVLHEGWGKVPVCLSCDDCFSPSDDDGPCFDDLQLAVDYFREQEEERGDYLLQQRRDRELE